MCHDEGITLDCNGRIGRFDRNNHVKFRDMTFEEVTSPEYAPFADAMGHYAKVRDFEIFVRICKMNGKTVYATVRGYGIPDMIAGGIVISRKDDMETNCVINSFTYGVIVEKDGGGLWHLPFSRREEKWL